MTAHYADLTMHFTHSDCQTGKRADDEERLYKGPVINHNNASEGQQWWGQGYVINVQVSQFSMAYHCTKQIAPHPTTPYPYSGTISQGATAFLTL